MTAKEARHLMFTARYGENRVSHGIVPSHRMWMWDAIFNEIVHYGDPLPKGLQNTMLTWLDSIGMHVQVPAPDPEPEPNSNEPVPALPRPKPFDRKFS